MESNIPALLGNHRVAGRERAVTVSTTRDAIVPPVDTDTSAKRAETLDMESPTVDQPPRIKLYGMRPKYLRYNVWDPDGNLAITTAEWTETAKPLPRPPPEQLMHPVIGKTISENPGLFKIVTPIRIEAFNDLLRDHPNQVFVRSVCDGLRYGFWPWANIWKPGYPDELDLSCSDRSDPTRVKFFNDQGAHEIAKERYSASVGPSLLPGMYCMPIYAVPKPHSSDLRLVNDHSASHFSLNSMIDHNCVTGYPMDNLAQFGEMLMELRRDNPDLVGPNSLTVWKSDISEAYRLCPLHPFWQIKQGVRLGSDYHVDRCIVFGSSASPAIFIAFNSLVTWIAKNKRNIPFIATYLDDSSGCTWSDDVAFYRPYNKYLPSPQARLLSLWDELGIPHKEKKQVHGSSIPVIGIQVDPNELTYTLPEESRLKLIEELTEWTSEKKGRRNVRRWQHLAGWINWCLNVYPLLRPALCNVYDKLRSQTNPNKTLWINNAVREDLLWALVKVRDSTGLRLLDSSSWPIHSATSTIYCDACPTGMGFWYPDRNLAFYSPTPVDDSPDLIFYFEALCVLCALLNACNRSPGSGRFIIYTDNLNTVDIFSSLSALPAYNILLREAVDLLMAGRHDLRVLHVPGEDNAIADALSRAEFTRALRLRPQLRGHIHLFSPYHRVLDNSVYILRPPREALGAAQ